MIGQSKTWHGLGARAMFATLFCVACLGNSAIAADKPNIVVIMGDDIGMWNIGAYHRGMMAGARNGKQRSLVL